MRSDLTTACTAALSEQHPREQGLKLRIQERGTVEGAPFRATSKRTRIETANAAVARNAISRLSEQHPREQGLKPIECPGFHLFQASFRATSKRTRIETSRRRRSPGPRPLSEQHPREQGLKQDRLPTRVSHLTPFRATSKRTRIETTICTIYHIYRSSLSEQHPREQGLKLLTHILKPPSNLLSEQHPREQGLKLQCGGVARVPYTVFQSNIQENKD